MLRKLWGKKKERERERGNGWWQGEGKARKGKCENGSRLLDDREGKETCKYFYLRKVKQRQS